MKTFNLISLSVLVSLSTAAITSKIIVSNLVNDFTSTITTDSDNYLREVESKVYSGVSRSENNENDSTSFIKSRLAGLFPSSTIGKIKPINEVLYLVNIDGNTIYIDKRGETIIKGTAIDVKSVNSPSEFTHAKVYKTSVATSSSSTYSQPAEVKKEPLLHKQSNTLEKQEDFDYLTNKSIHYPAIGDVKNSVLIFADPTCPKCQKLHKEIVNLNKSGVDVYYALISRRGMRAPIAEKIRSILCQPDQLKALDDAMLYDNYPESGSCSKTLDDFMFGALEKYKIKGTPFIVDRDGNHISQSDLLSL
jgi:protein-disulfide isomerase